jgi:hypothetical protein
MGLKDFKRSGESCKSGTNVSHIPHRISSINWLYHQTQSHGLPVHLMHPHNCVDLTHQISLCRQRSMDTLRSVSIHFMSSYHVA